MALLPRIRNAQASSHNTATGTNSPNNHHVRKVTHHLARVISAQVLQCQWFAQSTWGSRRACAVPAPPIPGGINALSRENANLISHLISEPCAIHMGPPPDQHRSASRLPL